MKTLNTTITVNNKKYNYTLTKKNKNIVRIVCEAAKIDQDFLAEDVTDLIFDLPALIIAEQEYQQNQSTQIQFRISPEDKAKVNKKAEAAGFKSVSEYLRYLALS